MVARPALVGIGIDIPAPECRIADQRSRFAFTETADAGLIFTGLTCCTARPAVILVGSQINNFATTEIFRCLEPCNRGNYLFLRNKLGQGNGRCCCQHRDSLHISRRRCCCSRRNILERRNRHRFLLKTVFLCLQPGCRGAVRTRQFCTPGKTIRSPRCNSSRPFHTTAWCWARDGLLYRCCRHLHHPRREKGRRRCWGNFPCGRRNSAYDKKDKA